jgi:hypothetical protein
MFNKNITCLKLMTCGTACYVCATSLMNYRAVYVPLTNEHCFLYAQIMNYRVYSEKTN